VKQQFLDSSSEMRIEDITPQNVLSISSSELSSLHRKVHQLYGMFKRTKTASTILTLKNKHDLISKELEKRKFPHFKSDLEEN
jgi:cobalamin biosynthesis Co2+ chelatase CbiK